MQTKRVKLKQKPVYFGVKVLILHFQYTFN